MNESLKEVEAKLLEQEHRLFKIIWNFINRNKWYEDGDPRKKAVTKAIIWRLFFSPTSIAIVLSGSMGLLSLFFLWKQTDLIEEQNNIIKNQTRLIESTRRAAQTSMLDKLYTEIHISISSNKKMTDYLCNRVTNISNIIAPYKFFDYSKDSVSTLLSPERARLLYYLVSSNIDTLTLTQQIFNEKANFEYADLSKLDLMDKNFNNINIRYSLFKETLLHKSKFINADIRNASFLDTGLFDVNFKNADLRTSKFIDVPFNGINLTNADLRETTYKNIDIGKNIILDNAQVDNTKWFENLKKNINYKNPINLINFKTLITRYKIIPIIDKDTKKTTYIITLK